MATSQLVIKSDLVLQPWSLSATPGTITPGATIGTPGILVHTTTSY